MPVRRGTRRRRAPDKSRALRLRGVARREKKARDVRKISGDSDPFAVPTRQILAAGREKCPLSPEEMTTVFGMSVVIGSLSPPPMQDSFRCPKNAHIRQCCYQMRLPFGRRPKLRCQRTRSRKQSDREIHRRHVPDACAVVNKDSVDTEHYSTCYFAYIKLGNNCKFIFIYKNIS